MHSANHIQKNLIERYTQPQGPEERDHIQPPADERSPERIRHFLMTAEHRKRQILERMLLD